MELTSMTVTELKQVAAGMRINVNFLRGLTKADIIDIIERTAAKDAVVVAVAEPFTREYHEANVDRVASALRQAVAEWFECDRDDAETVRRLQGRMQLFSRSMSAELAGIALINHREYNRSLA